MAKGSEVTLLGEETHRAGDVHGGEGLGGSEVGQPAGEVVDENAAELMVRTVRERPGASPFVGDRASDQPGRRPSPRARITSIGRRRDLHGRGGAGPGEYNAGRRGQHLA